MGLPWVTKQCRGFLLREMIEGEPLTGPPPPLFNKKYNFIQKRKTKQSKSTL
jgi:hypothetical protein